MQAGVTLKLERIKWRASSNEPQKIWTVQSQESLQSHILLHVSISYFPGSK